MANAHKPTIDGFGEEWSRFTQSELGDREARALFDCYFSLFPWSELTSDCVGFDLGCGSGRWAKQVAPRVGLLHCIDASEKALSVARSGLVAAKNCEFHHRSVDELPFAEGSMDFGYSLGVLHHVPDTQAALNSCVRLLKPGAPFLVYLYYRFDNRPPWYRKVWEISERLRRLVSSMPPKRKHIVTDAVATTVYFPLACVSRLLERCGARVESIPLSAYRNSSFYTMRTDALDRFGTQLEQRFTRAEIESMMKQAGLGSVSFREEVPFWCAIGRKGAG